MAEQPPPARRRIALIAGGSGTIGQAVTTALATRAVVYVGFSRHEESAQSLARQIREAGGRAEAVHLDLLDGPLVEQLCAEIFAREKALDILVNCAAINVEAPGAGMDDETWRAVMDTNLDGAFRLCREVAKYMVLGRWGRIVNISSIAAAHGGRGQVNYAASKAGLEALTRVLALELGRKGVLANCVAPGVIESAMSQRARRDYGDELLDHIAVRRFGSAREVADTVAFLCSEEAAYITGQAIRVDGGMAL